MRPGENKPEGPFGDHLGYYKLATSFSIDVVQRVYAKEKCNLAIYRCRQTTSGRYQFGIDTPLKLTGDALSKEIPGLKEIHAVDAAGVHPLLLAIGSRTLHSLH